MDLLSPDLKQGIESIDQIASLCQSDLEAVRAAAREATLSFGKEQHHMSCAVQWGSWVLRKLCESSHGQLRKAVK